MIPNEDSLRALYDRLFVRSANSPYAEDAPADENDDDEDGAGADFERDGN
jgi:hypothetical protein